MRMGEHINTIAARNTKRPGANNGKKRNRPTDTDNPLLLNSNGSAGAVFFAPQLTYWKVDFSYIWTI